MDGIERIISKIEQEAKQESDAVISEAENKAREILTAAEKKYLEDRENARLENEKEAEAIRSRSVTAAGMEVRKRVLALKQSLISEIFDEALRELCTMNAAKKTELLTALLVKAAPDGKGEVCFSGADAAQCGAEVVRLANDKLGGELTLSGKTCAIPGGFVLKNGDVEINCSFDALVRLQQEKSTGAVAKLLFR